MQFEDYLTYEPIDIGALLTKARNPYTGGMVMFSGEVRNRNKRKEVLYLEYEAYEPMARKKIAEIINDAQKKWKLNHAVCIHRLGKLEISDCAILVITGSVHRAEAYDANRYIVDRVKMEVPIWKNEFFSDGTNEWGNNSNCGCSKTHHQEPNS